MLQIIIITVFTLIVLAIAGLSLLTNPSGIIAAFKITPKVFRLHKPKDQGIYYLQLRLFYKYYYIYRTKNDYNLTIFHDRFCINYPNHLILYNKNKVFDDRYEIVKFFSEDSSPEDSITL